MRDFLQMNLVWMHKTAKQNMRYARSHHGENVWACIMFFLALSDMWRWRGEWTPPAGVITAYFGRLFDVFHMHRSGAHHTSEIMRWQQKIPKRTCIIICCEIRFAKTRSLLSGHWPKQFRFRIPKPESRGFKTQPEAERSTSNFGLHFYSPLPPFNLWLLLSSLSLPSLPCSLFNIL